MLQFVGEEVERLKGLFTAKEQRLGSERDAAHRTADQAQAQADTLRLQVQQLEARCSSFPGELQVRCPMLGLAVTPAAQMCLLPTTIKPLSTQHEPWLPNSASMMHSLAF